MSRILVLVLLLLPSLVSAAGDHFNRIALVAAGKSISKNIAGLSGRN
jgi:hypothetical protein